MYFSGPSCDVELRHACDDASARIVARRKKKEGKTLDLETLDYHAVIARGSLFLTLYASCTLCVVPCRAGWHRIGCTCSPSYTMSNMAISGLAARLLFLYNARSPFMAFCVIGHSVSLLISVTKCIHVYETHRLCYSCLSARLRVF